MKRLAILIGFGIVISGLSLAAGRDVGGDPSRGVMERFSAVLKSQSFSATMVFSASPARERSPMPPMESKFYVLQGMSRIEIDMAKAMAAASKHGGGGMPGLDKMIVIARPDKKVSYQVMPGLEAYCETAIPKDVSDQTDASAKIDRKADGSESVEGFECDKFINTVTTKDGKTAVVRTWEAKALGGMPVKLVSQSADGEATIIFKDIKTGKPDASLFEPPAGYQKYDSMQAMMMSGMMKMMKGGQ